MSDPAIVSQDDWLNARLDLLAKEKEFTRLRDELNAQRRAMPWVKVEKDYLFQTAKGEMALGDLFDGKSQLLVYHFMFGPDWEEGCPSCSFWADNFNGTDIHLAHRDIRFLAISRATLEKLQAYKERMGWDFEWVSSLGSAFNFDFQVSFTEDEMAQEDVFYNFHRTSFPADEAPGISVFFRDEAGAVFHTYSCYARGLDMLNGAYHYMDLVPKGRDESELPFTQAWVCRRDQYQD